MSSKLTTDRIPLDQPSRWERVCDLAIIFALAVLLGSAGAFVFVLLESERQFHSCMAAAGGSKQLQERCRYGH